MQLARGYEKRFRIERMANVFFSPWLILNSEAEALANLAPWRAGIRRIIRRARIRIVFYAFGLDRTRSFIEVRN